MQITFSHYILIRKEFDPETIDVLTRYRVPLIVSPLPNTSDVLLGINRDKEVVTVNLPEYEAKLFNSMLLSEKDLCGRTKPRKVTYECVGPFAFNLLPK